MSEDDKASRPQGTSAFASGPGFPRKASLGESLWEKAQAKARPSIQFSKSFRTLRDMMQDAEIQQGHLTKISRLGEGAFAVVEKCKYRPEKDFTREVALKRLKPNIFKSDLDLNDFVREALLLKRLRQANIVEFIGLGTDMERAQDESASVSPDCIFLVTEFMNKGTLYSRIVRQMKTSQMIYTRQEGLQWLIHISKALKYLHNSNPRVIHRDLKIENIMLTEESNGQVVAKIGDFGLHALIPPKQEGTPQTGSKKALKQTSRRFSEHERSLKKRNVTTLNDVFGLSGRTGSLMYMAPEVLRSQPYNEKADVYSFAIVMYEVMQKCMLLAFVSLRGIPSEVDQYIESVLCGFRPVVPKSWPKELRELLDRCWTNNIDERPTMDVVLETLLEIQKKNLWHEDFIKKQPRCLRCSVQ